MFSHESCGVARARCGSHPTATGRVAPPVTTKVGEASLETLPHPPAIEDDDEDDWLRALRRLQTDSRGKGLRAILIPFTGGLPLYAALLTLAPDRAQEDG